MAWRQSGGRRYGVPLARSGRKRKRKKVRLSPIIDGKEYWKSQYATYLKSDHWKALRKLKLFDCPWCEDCGASRKIQVHHLRYRDWLNCTVKDLKTLCRACHEKAHDLV